jgi:Trk K+ transport system NAD-binding subunit
MAAAASVEESVAEREDIDFVEVVITRHSPLYGRSLEDAGLSARFGVRVIGGWVHDSFRTSIAKETRLREHVRLFVAGTDDQLAALREEMAAYVRAFTAQSILLAGYGDSGHAVADSLQQAEGTITVLDLVDQDGVDIVGDVRDPDVLSAAGIETASALVIAVDDDTAATFATLVARDLNPDLQILVRAHQETAVQSLYRAGADFVQALPSVCGRMLAAMVFENHGGTASDQHVNVVRIPVPGLEGHSLEEVDPESLTSYTVLAVSRGDAFLIDPDESAFAFEADDEVIVAGTDDGLEEFRRQVEASAESA